MTLGFGTPRKPSIWRPSPRARRARRDVALAMAVVLAGLALILPMGASDIIREAMRQDPLGAIGLLAAVAVLPLGAAVWCLSRRRADAERLIAMLRIRGASRSARTRSARRAGRVSAEQRDALHAAALLEASTAICVALNGGVGAGAARTLREAHAALDRSAEGADDGDKEEHVDLAEMLDGLSASVRTAIHPGAPDTVWVNPRLLTALIENIAAWGRFSTEQPVVEVAMRDDGLILTIARHLSSTAPPEPLRLRQRAALLLGGTLTPMLKEDDVVVDGLALPRSVVSAPTPG